MKADGVFTNDHYAIVLSPERSGVADGNGYVGSVHSATVGRVFSRQRCKIDPQRMTRRD